MFKTYEAKYILRNSGIIKNFFSGACEIYVHKNGVEVKAPFGVEKEFLEDPDKYSHLASRKDTNAIWETPYSKDTKMSTLPG